MLKLCLFQLTLCYLWHSYIVYACIRSMSFPIQIDDQITSLRIGFFCTTSFLWRKMLNTSAAEVQGICEYIFIFELLWNLYKVLNAYSEFCIIGDYMPCKVVIHFD
ncbi:hypothetical protein DsansV1_C27g0204591 [Dioscorea sansibarensis]